MYEESSRVYMYLHMYIVYVYTLSPPLSAMHVYTQSEMKRWQRKTEVVSQELESLGDVRKTVQDLKKEIESLTNHNKVQTFYLYVHVHV